MFINDLTIIGISSLIASILLCLIGIPIARAVGWVDMPDARKQHEGSIPLIGGLVIVTVFIVGCLLTQEFHSFPIIKFLPAILLLLVTGTIDDRIHINPWVRFFIQICASFYSVAIFDNLTGSLGNLFGLGVIDFGWFKYIFFATCFVLFINALNMIDGVDGLSGGILTIMAGFLMMLVGIQSGLFIPLLILIASVLGFLLFNMRHPLRRKASIFIGDAGTLTLALIIGWMSIEAANEFKIEPISAAWFMTIPIIDTFSLFFIRVRQGRSPFSPDRLHLHHKLLDQGLPPGIVTLTMLTFVVITASIGYAATASHIPLAVFGYGWVVLWLGYTAVNLKLSKSAPTIPAGS